MFSTLPRVRDTNQTYFYTPHVSSPLSSSPLHNSPSPLSPRDANMLSRAADIDMSSPTKQSCMKVATPISTITPMFGKSALPSPPSSRKGSNFSKRTIKANPLIHGRGSAEEGRETRRKLFLKNVREASEEKKWKNRGGDDEIMRCIWVAEQRRLQERMRKEAMGVEAPMEEEEFSLDELMVEEVAMNEEQEMEAFLEFLNPNSNSQVMTESILPEHSQSNLTWHNPNDQVLMNQQDQLRSDTPYGSDDDEYDDIFMDVIQQEERMSSQQHSSGLGQDQDMMDMS